MARAREFLLCPIRPGRADPLQIQIEQPGRILPQDLLALRIRKFECLDKSDRLVRTSDQMGVVRPYAEVLPPNELEGAAYRRHMNRSGCTSKYHR